MAEEFEHLKFFHLLHAMIRVDEHHADPERSREVMAWVTGEGPRLRKVMTQDQRRLVMLAISIFRLQQSAPSRAILKEEVERQDKSEAMETLLREYDGLKKDIPIYSVNDCESLLKEMTEDWKVYAFITHAKHAINIARSGVTSDKKGEPDPRGPEDARLYMLKQLQSGLFMDETGAEGSTRPPTSFGKPTRKASRQF